MDSMNDFLRELEAGMDSERETRSRWHRIIRPTTVNIVLGKRGTGKSALAYWLTEELSQERRLTPVVINLPGERRRLLPDHYQVHDLDDMPGLSDAIILIDEGTTMLPAGRAKLEDMIKGCAALSRQRNQTILFVFHASADVGSRILRGVDAILLKEPSSRQINYGAKDKHLRELLTEAKARFKHLVENSEDVRAYTFVESEEPEFRGMLWNPLPHFWSDELSKAWAGIHDLPSDISTREQDVEPKPQLWPDEAEYWRLSPQIPNYPDEQVLAIEGKWSKKQLQDMAEKNKLRRSGDKYLLVTKLLYVGVFDGDGRPARSE